MKRMTLFMSAAIALGLSACSSDDTIIDNGTNGDGMAQWKFSGDKHKSLQVDTERTFHQRYPLVML